MSDLYTQIFPSHDKLHQLPLTTSALSSIASTVQAQSAGGFFWQIYKTTTDGQASATATAQAVCKVVLPGSPRCSGAFPSLDM